MQVTPNQNIQKTTNTPQNNNAGTVNQSQPQLLVQIRQDMYRRKFLIIRRVIVPLCKDKIRNQIKDSRKMFKYLQQQQGWIFKYLTRLSELRELRHQLIM